MQIKCILVIVSGFGESPLHGVRVVCAIVIFIYLCNPLQSLPGSLADPAHPGTTGNKSSGYTGESHGFPRRHQTSSRFNQENPAQYQILLMKGISWESRAGLLT
jgi:hypothetical protein